MNTDVILELLAHEPSSPVDIAQVALWLARDEYPGLDIEGYLAELDGMAHEVRRYLRGNLATQVHGLCRYLFHEMGFRGNTANYYDPMNSFLNQVLDRRRGIPITLSIVAMSVGQRAGLEMSGVGLPGHFVAKAAQADQEVIFDPFHGGRQLSAEQCAILVSQAAARPLPPRDDPIWDVPAALIAYRMLTNLKQIYLQAEDYPRATRTIRRLRQLMPDDPIHHRDLGASMLRSGQPGKAIDHLSAYLSARPDSPDATAVHKLLEQARSQVARLN